MSTVEQEATFGLQFLRGQLKRNRDEREGALATYELKRLELIELLKKGKELGLTVAEMVELAGVSVNFTYTVIRGEAILEPAKNTRKLTQPRRGRKK